MGGEIPGLGEVYLVGHEYPRSLLVLPEHFVPHLNVQQRVGACHIVDEDCAVGVFEIGGDEAAVALLSGGVPHLHSVVVAAAHHILNVEIDAHCWLGGEGATLWVSS